MTKPALEIFVIPSFLVLIEPVPVLIIVLVVPVLVVIVLVVPVLVVPVLVVIVLVVIVLVVLVPIVVFPILIVVLILISFVHQINSFHCLAAVCRFIYGNCYPMNSITRPDFYYY